MRNCLRNGLAAGDRGKHLSTGERLILINSILSSLPLYMMSFFAIPRVLKKLDYYRSRFYWQSHGHKRKNRHAKWNILCRPRDQGGLGKQDMKTKNDALLSKWLFKLLTTDGIWQRFIRNKYMGTKPLLCKLSGNLGTHTFGQVL